MKRTYTYSMKAETRRQSIVLLFTISWGHVHWGLTFFTTLHMSVNDYESTESIDFGVTDKL